MRALLEGGLAGCIRVRQHRSVDMDHDLISLARRARIDVVVQGRLREQPQGISLLLRDGGRFRGTRHVAIATPRPAETLYSPRVEEPEVGHVTGADRARRGT